MRLNLNKYPVENSLTLSGCNSISSCNPRLKFVTAEILSRQTGLCCNRYKNRKLQLLNSAGKVSKYGVFSGPYFPALGLNTQRYSVSLRIHSECEKIRIRKNSVFGHFHAVKSSNVKLGNKGRTEESLRSCEFCEIFSEQHFLQNIEWANASAVYLCQLNWFLITVSGA